MKYWIARLMSWLRDRIEDLPCPFNPYCRECKDCGRCCYHGEPCR